ncbi:PREDICTED: Golgi apparatus membrane protein TVP23 homolog A-like [Priapulus caudatus]|uniref:Golgi apparatus membrane protein TVP23 homolog n=1 Tax=Priapulus caudatus TaxID=37621 RepID=A0ABM1E795_PRICU|nr:PREDICTED: Golgi apparatus membrane protein TVP23 homolog A-like [Priapulus caudatus]
MATNTRDRQGLLDDTEDVALEFGAEDDPVSRRKFKHPLVSFFQLAFRTAAIVAYLFCGWFSNSFVLSFVVIVVLLALDFWTVKNVSGRLLAGLRWWNYVDDDGKSHWVYEASKNKSTSKYTLAESRLFWLSLVIFPIIWCVFFFSTLVGLKFQWFMVVCVSLVLQGANLHGYIRCKVGAKQKLSSVAASFLGQQVLRNVAREAARQ